METYDIPGTRRYVTAFVYPEGPRPPMWELGCRTAETEHPYRIGFGLSLRIPGTKVCVILGRWLEQDDDEVDEVERLTAALEGRTLFPAQQIHRPKELNSGDHRQARGETTNKPEGGVQGDLLAGREDEYTGSRTVDR